MTCASSPAGPAGDGEYRAAATGRNWHDCSHHHPQRRTAIPQLGFGVFQVPPEQTRRPSSRRSRWATATSTPRRCTATRPASARRSRPPASPREELYITTKLNNGFHRPDDARRAFDESLEQLGLDQVDLFLIHWPLPTRYDGDYVSTWRTLAELARGRPGRARSASRTSSPRTCDRIIDETGVLPAVNQIEVHPFFGNEAARAAGASTASRPRPGRRSPRAGCIGDEMIGGDRRRARQDARAGRPALAHPARRHRVPEVDARRADARELRDLRLLASRPTRSSEISALDRGEDGRIGPNPNKFDTSRTDSADARSCGLVPNGNRSGLSMPFVTNRRT